MGPLIAVLAILLSFAVPGVALQLVLAAEPCKSRAAFAFGSLLLGLSVQILGVSVAFMLGLPKSFGFVVGCVVPVCLFAGRSRRGRRKLSELGWKMFAFLLFALATVSVCVDLDRPMAIGPDFLGNSIAMRGIEGSRGLEDLIEDVSDQAILLATATNLVFPWIENPVPTRRETVYSLPRNSDQYAAEFILSGMRVGLTSWGAVLSNPARSLGLSVFGLTFTAELSALVGAAGLCWSNLRRCVNGRMAFGLSAVALAGIPASWGWLQSGGSAFVGTAMSLVSLTGVVAGGRSFFADRLNLMVFAALGVTYPDLWLIVVVLALAVFMAESKFWRSRRQLMRRVGPQNTKWLLLLIPAVVIQPAFLRSRFEDASVGGWSAGSAASPLAPFGLDDRWFAVTAFDRSDSVHITSVVVLYSLAAVALLAVIGVGTFGRRLLLMFGLLTTLGGTIHLSTNDYLHSKFWSYFAGFGLVLICLIASEGLSSRRISGILTACIFGWTMFGTSWFVYGVAMDSVNRMSSSTFPVDDNLQNLFWVRESGDFYGAANFLASEGALGFVDSQDSCRASETPVVVKVESGGRLVRSVVPVGQLQPLNDFEEQLRIRCVGTMRND